MVGGEGLARMGEVAEFWPMRHERRTVGHFYECFCFHNKGGKISLVSLFYFLPSPYLECLEPK